jgi:hypothetical protein
MARFNNSHARANTVFPRDPGQRIYGPDSEWVMGFADKDTTFLTNGARREDAATVRRRPPYAMVGLRS